MKRFINEVRLVLSVLAFLVIIGEGGLRLCSPELFPEEIQHWLMDHLSLGHPALGAIERPHATSMFVGRDFRVVYRTDSKGFHNSRPWPEAADIVVLGDGMTLGYGVDTHQAWPALVAQAVAPNRLLNLALLGAGPLQYARAYELFGTPLHPKVVLVGLSLTDDFQDAVLFNRWQQAGVGSNYRVWHSSGGISGGWAQPLGSVHALLAQHSLLYQMVRLSLLVDPPSSKIVWLPGGQYLQMWPGRLDTVIAQARPEQPSFELAFEALAYLQVIARAYGTQVVVLFLPSKEEIYLPLQGETPRDPGRAIREALKERGLITLDLAPLLHQWGSKGELLFFAASRYLNEQGHAFIAHYVLQHLAASVQTYDLRPWHSDVLETPQASLRERQ